MRNINVKGATYIAYTWGPEGHYVTERRGFTTMEGAERFAENESEKAGIIEVSVCVKDKAAGAGRVRRICTYKRGGRHQA